MSFVEKAFRPRARLLKLLGDELIGSPRLAVFELVKNSYDADSSQVTIKFSGRKKIEFIQVLDDGEGMDLPTILNIWLVPGSDHRKQQKESNDRTPQFHRLPLGEKGLGRFAVHKLGDRIRLVTRARGQEEHVIDINWSTLTELEFLDQSLVKVTSRTPELFTGDSTGTLVEVGDLNAEWTRGDVRRLYQQIASICSPYDGKGEFSVEVELPGREHWISDLPDSDEILKQAIWLFEFTAAAGMVNWSYEFRKISRIPVEPRCKSDSGRLLVLREGDRKSSPSGPEDFKGIGPIKGRFYIYDRDKEILENYPNTQILKSFLDQNGGIRVYRDGIRVYNYGEQNNDWLGLDIRRVNAPKRKVSNNIVLGAIYLELNSSGGLKEKTNREGFVESETLERLKALVLGALTIVEAERFADKLRLRQASNKRPDPSSADITRPMTSLRIALRKRHLLEDFDPYLRRIEKEFKTVQETLLSAGMAGLNLAMLFHEVERSVKILHRTVADEGSSDHALKQTRELMHLLDGFSALLRKDSKKSHTARDLIDSAVRLMRPRLRFHQIDLVCPILSGSDIGFEASFSFHLVLGVLTNLIDNSLYWLQVRWPKESGMRKLLIDVVKGEAGAPMIVVSDNGPGFRDDPPELVVRPFFTRKPEGMGLGLYYSSLAMDLNDGRLHFLSATEWSDEREQLDGAIVALEFGAQGA